MLSTCRIASPAALAAALHDYEDLLLTEKKELQPAATPDKKKKPVPEPYDRERYFEAAEDRKKAFNNLYLFCFMLAKPP